MGRPLAIKVLDVIVYPPSGWGHTTTTVRDPTWEQVEAAIRALDHFCRPFIFLGLREEEDRTTSSMSILGGPDGYAISVVDEDGNWLQYCDPSHTGGEVPVWTSDQGYDPEERYVSYDLDLVLRVARHYAELGELDPSVLWEE